MLAGERDNIHTVARTHSPVAVGLQQVAEQFGVKVIILNNQDEFRGGAIHGASKEQSD
jgi:hypothetical protein